MGDFKIELFLAKNTARENVLACSMPTDTVLSHAPSGLWAGRQLHQLFGFLENNSNKMSLTLYLPIPQKELSFKLGIRLNSPENLPL